MIVYSDKSTILLGEQNKRGKCKLARIGNRFYTLNLHIITENEKELKEILEDYEVISLKE